ncbi:undecaprenyl/decaprenyl-phosphate alpha-N-acetylglucosaminyl 1-phosphate transferase, partial [Streptomyces sp. NPDC059037]
LLLPRFTPHIPRWAESFVPPRSRRRRRAAAAGGDAGDETNATAGTDEQGETEAEVDLLPPVDADVNGATAVGTRSRFEDRRKAGSSS